MVETKTKTQSESPDFIVKYKQNYYDVTKFLKNHPGGINTLKGLNQGDMTERFMKAPPHSDAAMYLLNEYKIDGEGMPLNSKKIINGDSNNNQIKPQLDDSMEHLVDWNKAMVPQIAKITANYDEWVHKPVDRPLRLFEPWYLEVCTKTPWWVVPTFWIPVIFYCIVDKFSDNWHRSEYIKICGFTLYFAIGILFWTLLEYVLHRWLFHIKTKDHQSSTICTMHFILHGLHHKVPFDPLRLVFPPLPGVVLASIIYFPLSFIMPNPRILLGGALFGYLCYDMMHYYLHYGSPTREHLYYMKRYHYQHHFAHQDQGYGITSPLWDFVFNTRIHLRKLRFVLKWK